MHSNQDPVLPGGEGGRYRLIHRLLWLTFVLALVISLYIPSFAANSVRIIRMEPSGEVSPKTNFVFTFSADVVTKPRIGKLMSNNRIRFKPEVPGKIRWESSRRLKFLPEAPLQPSTAYTVEFKPDFLEELKKNLTGERKFKFTTERFRITGSNLDFIYNPARKRGIIFQARLSFNYPVAIENLERQLSLVFVDKRQPIKFSITQQNGGRDALITSELLIRGTKARKVELSLPQNFLCTGAKIGLKDKFVKGADFREEQNLNINEINAQSEDGQNVITIRCSEPVDPDVAVNFISLKPKTEFRISTSGEQITLSGSTLKPGQTYLVKINKGLPALNGKPLEREFSDEVTFPDLEPSVSFSAPGRYLASKGYRNLGMETVNISKVEVEVAKVFANNIVSFLSSLNDEGYCYSSDLERYGRVIQTLTYETSGGENDIITTPVNLSRYLDGQRGIFQIYACDPENRWRSTAKIAVITDLGIMAKMGGDDLVVWVNSLDNLTPKSGVKVSLVSFNNQEIVSGTTDADGKVRFSGLRQQMENFRSYVILAEQADDLSFVCLDDSLIDKTDFNVAGRPQTQGYEAFVYTDRGVFRPGDDANIVAIIRGANAAVPPEFPVRLEVIGPDGLVFREFAATTKEDGICQFHLAIPDYARTGKYTALMYVAKQSIGSTAFNVEDFIPDRIKVETLTNKDRFTTGESAKITVRGTNLFGPPATGRRVEVGVRLEPVIFSPAAYRSYTFGDSGREFRTIEEDLGQTQLDADGQASFDYNFPDNLYPPGYIRAVFQATVTEDGGRSVSNYKAAEFHPYKSYIGYKTKNSSYAKIGETYPISLVEVSPDGKPFTNKTLVVDVFSVTWNSIYRRDRDGEYSYSSERQETRISLDSVKLTDGEGVYNFRPKDYGYFKIVFADPNTGARSVYELYASGWGYAPWAMDHPDRVQLDLDQSTYKTGQNATLQIKAPFSGRALITVEREKVYDTRVVDLKGNTAEITIPVKPEYKPNVYIGVHLIRAIKDLDKRAPTRAFGVIPLMVDSSENRINLAINAKDEIRPNQQLEVIVTATGQSGSAYLTLAAVDEGICQLTDFQTPDPLGFFYGKRALGIETYDMYGMLLPEVKGVNLPDSPAGDENLEGVRRRNLNPVAIKRVKPVSLWSGPVKLDNQGQTRIKLNIPQFNGTLRLMAVAASGANFGSAARKVIVRDQLVITSTYPRFMAPGDRVVIPVTLFNGTGADGRFDVKLDFSGPVTVDGYDVKQIAIPDQQERTVNFAIIAKQATGACKFSLTAKGNSVQTVETTELGVRPAQSVTSRNIVGAVHSGKAQEINFGSEWLPGTGEYSLSLAPIPALRFGGALKYLLTYPYGCLEQTTSKLFPLLYFEDLARVTQPDLFAGGRAEKYLSEGIEKLQSMQLRNGSFSFWPNSDWSSDWGTVYASHFLVEARKAGHLVSDRVYDRMIGYLWQLGKQNTKNSYALQLRTYSLYVLSLAGKPQTSSMAYIKSQRFDDLYSDAKAMLAAAYYYAGDKKTARDLMPTTFAAYNFKRQKGANLDSPVRNDAIVLAALADVDPLNPAVPKLIARLSDNTQLDRWGTTQENAFAFMAMGKILKNTEEPNYTGEVLCDGKQIASFNSQAPVQITDSSLGQGKITIKMNGRGVCYFWATTSGIAPKPSADVDNGISVRREFFDKNGAKVDLARIQQGDLLVAKITVKTAEDNTDNVAIVDLLPTGLEIENPRLATSSKINWLDKDTFTPHYMDIRDDRIILFADFEDAGVQTFYYAVRAVASGGFILPQIKAECMYAPEVASLSSGGKITIERGK